MQARHQDKTQTKFEPYLPIAFSGEAYTFHESEKKIIDELRSWSHRYFKDFQVFDSDTTLPQKQTRKDGNQFYRDFDIQGKVVMFDFFTPKKKT